MRRITDETRATLDGIVGADGYLRLTQTNFADAEEFYLNVTRASINLTDVTTLKKVEEWPNNGNNLFVDVSRGRSGSGIIKIKCRFESIVYFEIKLGHTRSHQNC